MTQSWELHDPRFPRNPGLGVLSVDMVSQSGTIQYLGQTAQLTTFTRISATHFGAKYNLGRFSGLVDGEILDDGSLRVKFLGSTRAVCTGTQITNISTGQLQMALVANQFKCSFDLAGVAETLYYQNPGAPFVWSNEGSDLVDAHSKDDLLMVRRMCCFEFVHYCAFIAGPQRTGADGNGPAGLVMCGSAGRSAYGRTYTVWDGKSVIPRGKVVVGVAKLGSCFNNRDGFYHIGISTGRGTVISLRGGTNLSCDKTGDVFDSWYYSEVRISDYSWQQNTGGAPR